MLTHGGESSHRVRVTQTRTSPLLGEAALSSEGRALLQQVGSALDKHRPLRVHDHGLVAVDMEFIKATPPMENGDERQAKRGPAARSRERPARRQGTAGGSRTPGAAPRIVDGLRAAYGGQVSRLAEAYPTLKTFPDGQGLWLLAKSSIISGLAREAAFLVALPYRLGPGPRAWGFWTAAGQDQWIGPRHTNLGDGSICAFSPDDGVWSEGGDLRTLLDFYSVWALRHLHLEVFGRWPGKQYSLHGFDPTVQAFYRQRECKDDELCGCGSETRRYVECCKPADLQCDVIRVGSLFLQQVPGGFMSRQPPPSVVGFIEGQSALPRMADVHLQIASP